MVIIEKCRNTLRLPLNKQKSIKFEILALFVAKTGMH